MLLPIISGAQSPPVKALDIGDTVPDIEINHIINYPTSTAKFSDFKSNLLILDFWATWCSSCLSNFPKMEALQKEFAGSVRILAVTGQSFGKIKAFFASEAGQKYDFISVTGDTVLNRLFPHRLIPHLVWISREGVITAITSADEVTAVNIRRQLEQQPMDIAVKKDLQTNRPLFLSAGYPAGNKLLYYSILSKGAYPGLGSGTAFRRQNGIIRGRAFTNEVLINIYEAAMWPLFRLRHDTYSQKRLILRVKDTADVLLTKGEYGLYSTANAYNFDIIVPVALADSLYPIMLRDLNRYSDFCGTIEKREEWCLVLRRTGTTDKIRTHGGKKQNTLFYKSPSRLTNYPVSFLVNELNSLKSIPLPVLDETGYTGHVDLELSGATDLKTLSKELQHYGLTLAREKRCINMFVLTDKK
jgi:thiol-disulfide isomerase/thioredoxin